MLSNNPTNIQPIGIHPTVTEPTVIQGGMGIAVSNWRLARAVSRLGQLGVVSGTALDQVLARRLQDGDPDGQMRHGLNHFPFPEMAERIWDAYFILGGKRSDQAYKRLPMHVKDDAREMQELCIVANFVEVFLAREGHTNPVGINYLEKVQIPHLPSIYGAMLAGALYVLMGAGIPLKIPGVLDSFVNHSAASYPMQVTPPEYALLTEPPDAQLTFVPRDFMEKEMPPLERPKFLAIIASNTLATTMVKKANGRVDGFIVEGPTAGGHNAPPRGKLQLTETGEPIYGERDMVNLAQLRELQLPFWLAGGYGNPAKLHEALADGAAGIQVGTAFAFCDESGLAPEYKQAILHDVKNGTARVVTDPLASPTSFPFKVVQVAGSLSDEEVYDARPRICDLGYLREAYTTPDGTIGYRCAGEPENVYLGKGGKLESTEGRKCLCNALLANIGLPQIRNNTYKEQALITAGNDLNELLALLPEAGVSYSAEEVVGYLMESKIELSGISG